MLTCEFPEYSARYAYQKGCRCLRCRGANADRARAYRRSKGIKPRAKVDNNGNLLPTAYKIKEDCWEWQQNLSAGGYGRVSVEGRTWLAHRYMFYRTHGYLPEVVMHVCDNPPCVNPNHLKGGTQIDNIKDMITKGRGNYKPPKGQDHGMAKVTDEEVLEIKEAYSEGLLTQKMLGDIYGISDSQVSNIIRGRQRPIKWIEEHGTPLCPHGEAMELEVKE